MNKFYAFLENRLAPVAAKLSAQRHLASVRDGIMLAMPFLIIGSVFMIIQYLPIPGYEDFMANIFGSQWQVKLGYPVEASYNIMAILACFGVAYRLAEKYKTADPLMSGAVALVSFILTIPQITSFTPEGSKTAYDVGGVIPTILTGSQGLFVAIVIALGATEIFRVIFEKNWVIKMPDGVPEAVGKSFIALIPGFITITTVWILRLLIELTPFSSINEIISTVIGIPMHYIGSTLPGMIVTVIIIALLWSIGLHGDAIIGAFTNPVWLANMDENRAAFQAGKELPNVVTQQFYELWIVPGGTGALLGLVILLFWRAKSKQMKQLAKISGPASVFNISEPIVFGVPIVLNPYFIIPFVLTPVLLVIMTYFGMESGLVAKPAGIALPWTTPPIISGFLATGGKISGSIMQIINILVAMLIYWPFFKVWDAQKYKEEQALTNEEVGSPKA
ncbi:PTS system, cellobiose-specific IIC component [Listeria newyorkensis]|uniref:Permease IIC component n=1 Tax=Listeria newyorkensis TaxID=1497681 RepID=A0ABX4XNS3_9LIST|nr:MULTISPECIES: PTS cellobiose transporter subunit IIC [Listeria]KGL42296.1 oligo-beta-mannoside permease IIC protein [Listeriaceae bacterium FSL A5-0209]KGL38726.1 oligo-beta-mannoside permease IIC protein [Listeria newyorkensis]PNP92697.1 PTS system, cellobiose-specific IIC component [Listeria newyorkensis]RQW66496.1 PTS cellobiose transporter subunit IIC [Listeria sp. SHR_NRA_18]WAO23098.1 PTS cellobiose transporter subunit IIC [Listeria newyorkensis]